MSAERRVSESLAVPAALAGERVDRAVALLTGWSRAEVQVLIDDAAVLVDGRTVIKSRRLAEGEVVDLLAEPAAGRAAAGRSRSRSSSCSEDADVIVVDKPAGIIVHPGAGHPDGTLVNGLLDRYPELAGVGDPARPGIVHRLDANTSGLLAVARTPVAYDALVAALARPHGGPRLPRARLGHARSRGAGSSTRRSVARSAGRRAWRSAKAAARPAPATRSSARFDDPDVSLLRCTLETGRTHQIRVHLAAINHPVVGDPGVRRDPGRRSTSPARSCTPRRSRSTTRSRASRNASRRSSRPTSCGCSTSSTADDPQHGQVHDDDRADERERAHERRCPRRCPR